MLTYYIIFSANLAWSQTVSTFLKYPYHRWYINAPKVLLINADVCSIQSRNKFLLKLFFYKNNKIFDIIIRTKKKKWKWENNFISLVVRKMHICFTVRNISMIWEISNCDCFCLYCWEKSVFHFQDFVLLRNYNSVEVMAFCCL